MRYSNKNYWGIKWTLEDYKRARSKTATPSNIRWTDLQRLDNPASRDDIKVIKPKPWVAPKRVAENDNTVIVKLNLSSVQTLSYIRFKLLDTPCTWKLFYLDSNVNQLLPLTNSLDEVLQGEVVGNEANLDNEDPETMQWVTIEALLSNINTKLVEIHIKRRVIYIDNGNDIARASGIGYKFGLYRTEPYRIGIKEFEGKVLIRYSDSSVVYEPHTVSNEIIEIEYNNPNQAVDRSNSTAWVSKPQAAAKSIVPFYLDLRDDNEAVTFDTMDIVPLYPGPLFSIYYSNDDDIPEFYTSNAFYNLMEENNGSQNVMFETNEGLSFTNLNSFLKISNKQARVNLEDSFSFGLEWKPKTIGTNSATNHYLITLESDTRTVSVKYDSTAKRFIVLSGSTTLVQSSQVQVSNSTSYSVVVSYENHQWKIRVAASEATNLGTSTSAVTSAWSGFWPTNILIGNNSDYELSALGYIKNLWIRLSSVDESSIDAFVSSPSQFTLRNDGSTISGNYQAVLLAPLKTNAKAAMGPNLDFYERKRWIPLSDDYKLGNTSTYDLPRITAKYLALEFTNLVPQFYRASANELLELRDFKNEIKAYYRSLPNSYFSFPQGIILNLFEGLRSNVYNRSAETDLPALRDVLTYGDGGPVFIYSKDQSTIDYLKDPAQYDRNTTLEELKFAIRLMKFFKNVRHDYDLESVLPETDRAFFVGIKDIRLFRAAQDIPFDTVEYFDTFCDLENVQSSTNVELVKSSEIDGYLETTNSNAVVVSKTFESLSTYHSAQMAVLDGPWKTTMSEDKIDLVDLSGLSAVNSTFAAEPLSLYQGSRIGNVISVTGTSRNYGVRTSSLTYSPTNKQRISAAVRILTDKRGSGKGEYVLNLKGTVNSQVVKLATKKIPVSQNWQEADLVYISNGNETNLYAEVLQVSRDKEVVFLVDMLGIWYNPVIWEVSNDNGTNYIVLARILSDSSGFVKFPTADKRLKVRITVTEADIALSAWSVVPDYRLTYMLNKEDNRVLRPWTSSDNPKLRSVLNNPLYRLKSRPWPRKFSISR